MGASADWRVAGRLVAALMLVGAVSACGGQTVVTEGDVTLLVHKGSLLPRGGTDAVVAGSLVLRNGCVGLVVGDRVLAVIWPSGTELADVDPLTVRLPSGSLVTEGESVQGTGGFPSPDSPNSDLVIPAACELDPDEIAAFNPDDDPVVVD